MHANKKNLYLQGYKKNIYSQFGEDGIIDEILNRLSNKINLDKWCVEFGAWDGVLYSNTCNLIKKRKYNALLIEPDKVKYKKLKKNFPQDNIIKVRNYVELSSKKNLESYLSKYKLPKNPDLLSIDIDGMDYYIFQSLNKYKPKILCIEYNPSIPNDIKYIQENNFSIKIGSSALALNDLAKVKGYFLVAATSCNLIFVNKKYIKFIFKDKKLPTLNQLLDDANNKNYIFFGYDGTIISNKEKIVFPWHDGFLLDIASNQYLPKFFRQYPGDWSKFKKILFRIYRFFIE